LVLKSQIRTHVSLAARRVTSLPYGVKLNPKTSHVREPTALGPTNRCARSLDWGILCHFVTQWPAATSILMGPSHACSALDVRCQTHASQIRYVRTRSCTAVQRKNGRSTVTAMMFLKSGIPELLRRFVDMHQQYHHLNHAVNVGRVVFGRKLRTNIICNTARNYATHKLQGSTHPHPVFGTPLERMTSNRS